MAMHPARFPRILRFEKPRDGDSGASPAWEELFLARTFARFVSVCEQSWYIQGNAERKGAMLEVRKARVDEFDAVLDFYMQVVDEMQGTEFDIQWRRGGHPSPAFLRESVEAGRMYIGVEGAEAEGASADAPTALASAADPVIACAMVVNHEGAPGYASVDWAADVPDEAVGVLHVVATSPAFRGRGYGRRLVLDSVELARAEGLAVLRLDTFPYNTRGRCLYESCGFTDKGTWTVNYPDMGDIQVEMYELVL